MPRSASRAKAPPADGYSRHDPSRLVPFRGVMRTHRTLLTALTLTAALISVRAARADLPMPGARAWSVRQTPVVEVVRRVKEAVVNIHSERTVRSQGADEL